MNLRNFIFVVVLSSLCVNTIAFKKRGKAKIKKSNTISLPGCGCQNPLFNIVDCGCRNPVIDTSYPVTTYEIPYGCQNPVSDIPQYRYFDTIEISALGYLNPIEMSNYGYQTTLLTPGIEYVAPVELPCGCQGPKCGCRDPIKLPAYPYGSLIPIEVPNCGCQELRPGYAAVSPIVEIASFSPMIQVPGCGCLGSCGCQSPLVCGCPGPICLCQSPMPCGCPGPICGCQNLMPCGCPGPICGCQSSMPCGCPGPICGCQSSISCGCPDPACGCQSPLSCGCQGTLCGCQSLSCGCSGPTCGCQSPLPCGCQGPLCGCQTLSCGCPGPMCGCQSFETTLCGCGYGVPECQCGGKYLRQITLQPPFL